jgi:hypothetical protein
MRILRVKKICAQIVRAREMRGIAGFFGEFDLRKADELIIIDKRNLESIVL